MRTVTEAAKCYIFVCVGCGLLSDSERSDRLTCSNACRVRAHRNGSMKALRETAALPSVRVPAALIVQCDAVTMLRPDLADRIMAGELTLDDVRRDVAREFCALVFAQIGGGAA